MRIALYTEEYPRRGIAEEFPKLNVHWQRSLTNFWKESLELQPVTASEIKAGVLEDGFDLLLMGGGSSSAFARALKKEGNDRIRDFVASGGCYLGVCAGSYYAHETIHWQPERMGEIVASRSQETALGLLHEAQARGPLLLAEDRRHASGVEEIVWLTDADPNPRGRGYDLFYHGGPISDLSRSKGAVNVLANFSRVDQPAIVESTYGKGCVIGCSPHVEWTSSDIQEMLEHPARAPKMPRPDAVAHELSNWYLAEGVAQFASRLQGQPPQPLSVEPLRLVLKHLETFIFLRRHNSTQTPRVTDALGSRAPFPVPPPPRVGVGVGSNAV